MSVDADLLSEHPDAASARRAAQALTDGFLADGEPAVFVDLSGDPEVD